ncbi:MAG: EVE domain-containing protein, partial [Aliidongia sp.]
MRNHQAALNLKSMKVGEKAFFYHSNEGLDIVGVAEIVREGLSGSERRGRAFRHGRHQAGPAGRTAGDAEGIKADPRLAEFALVRQSRLSVVPVRDTEWTILCEMAGIPA